LRAEGLRAEIRGQEVCPTEKQKHLSRLPEPSVLCRGLLVIASRKVFLEPHVEDDEEVAAAHFFDFEFGQTGADERLR